MFVSSKFQNGALLTKYGIITNDALLTAHKNLNSHILNEAFGVFDYNEQYYRKLFYDIITVAKQKLHNNKETVELLKDNNTKFFKYSQKNYDFCNLHNFY